MTLINYIVGICILLDDDNHVWVNCVTSLLRSSLFCFFNDMDPSFTMKSLLFAHFKFVNGVQHILCRVCFVCLRFVCSVLPVSLVCPFLIAPSVFSNFYFILCLLHISVPNVMCLILKLKSFVLIICLSYICV
jgi:hypothetical protein